MRLDENRNRHAGDVIPADLDPFQRDQRFQTDLLRQQRHPAVHRFPLALPGFQHPRLFAAHALDLGLELLLFQLQQRQITLEPLERVALLFQFSLVQAEARHGLEP